VTRADRRGPLSGPGERRGSDGGEVVENDQEYRAAKAGGPRAQQANPETGEVLEKLEMPRPVWACRGSSLMAGINSSVGTDAAGKFEPCAGPGDDPRWGVVPSQPCPQLALNRSSLP
jgi:hypothetical protein